MTLDLSYQDAEYAAWTAWRPESPPDKRDAHCHGFDAGYKAARDYCGEHAIIRAERAEAALAEERATLLEIIRNLVEGDPAEEDYSAWLAEGEDFLRAHGTGGEGEKE